MSLNLVIKEADRSGYSVVVRGDAEGEMEVYRTAVKWGGAGGGVHLANVDYLTESAERGKWKTFDPLLKMSKDNSDTLYRITRDWADHNVGSDNVIDEVAEARAEAKQSKLPLEE